MAEITHKFPKGLFSDQDDPDTWDPKHDVQMAWAVVSRKTGTNAECFIRSEHDDENWVFVLDKDREFDPSTPGMEGEV